MTRRCRWGRHWRTSWLGWVWGPAWLCGLGLLPAPTHGQQLAPLEVTLSAPARVPIAAGYAWMGADQVDQAYGRALCLAAPRTQAAGESESAACGVARFAQEGPVHRVYLDAYAIDRTEVSVEAYARCMFALQCPALMLPEQGDLPVTGVHHAAAARYCRFVGGRLPSEAEWERAARGGRTRRFPWGRQWNPAVARHGGLTGRDLLGRALARWVGPGGVDGMDAGRSPYGLLHMAGNVWEWTADYYEPGYYGRSPGVAPRGPSQGTLRVIRGGSFQSTPDQLRVTARRGMAPDTAAGDVGFRCAYDRVP